MNTSLRPHSSIGWTAAAAGVALGAYAAYVGTAWCRYGRISRASPQESRTQAERPPAPSMERA